jgi:hypothetical protein
MVHGSRSTIWLKACYVTVVKAFVKAKGRGCAAAILDYPYATLLMCPSCYHDSFPETIEVCSVCDKGI